MLAGYIVFSLVVLGLLVLLHSPDIVIAGYLVIAAVGFVMAVRDIRARTRAEFAREIGAAGDRLVARATASRNAARDLPWFDEVSAAQNGAVSFRVEDKRKGLALQAADILAYELYQDFPRQLGTDARSRRRYNLDQLAANKSWDWRYVSGTRMREDWARVTDLAAHIAEHEPWPRRMLPDDWRFPEPEASGSSMARNLAIRPNPQTSRKSRRRR
jgi:hypothetical protein